MDKKEYMNIPAEKFQFVDRGDRIHDKKFDTKICGFFCHSCQFFTIEVEVHAFPAV